MTTRIDEIKIEHDRQVATFLKEKEKINKEYDKQIDNLTAQLEELKIKNENSEILRKEAMELNAKLSSSQVLFYSILYVIKEQHEQVLEFSVESQLQSKKKKELQAIFNNLKIWEVQGTNFPPGYSKMSEEEKIQMQASLDSWQSNCLSSQGLIEEASKNCSVLWDATIDIIEEYEMPHVQFLGKSVPLSNCLTDVQQQADSRENGINTLSFWNLEGVQQFLTRPIECSKEIDNFLSIFSSGREEIAKKIYRCKLNKEVPQPPLIALLLEKVSLWQSPGQMQGEKVITGVVGSQENIFP
jgi:hypothetical protein